MKKKYFIGFIIVLILFVLVEIFKPKQTDWTVSFSRKDKIPFGTFVLFDLMKETYPKNMLKTQRRSFREFIEQQELSSNTNYIIITEKLDINDLDINDMLQFVERGNNMFISALFINQAFLDSLNIETDFKWLDNDTLNFNFSNPQIKDSLGYSFSKKTEGNYIKETYNSEITILGTNNDLTNYVKINYGEGNFFVNCQPFLYTNYNLLKVNNYEYVFKSLSYLPEQKTYWDEYYKPANESNNKSPLRVVFNSPTLLTAYYLLLVGVLLYMLFIGKRQQRIVPVIKPLKNTSLEFSQTIALLYLHKRNHRDLAQKKIKFFLENIKLKYYINSAEFNDKHIERISEKTGTSTKTIRVLLRIFNNIRISNRITDRELFALNKTIERFYNEAS